MRILITAPWGECLGGAEEMLQMAIDGAAAEGHEVELVFLQDGPWPAELARAGFHVEVIAVGRLRDLYRSVAAVTRLARLMRRRRPALILNWMTKTQLYGGTAALLAGMGGRVVWWQHGIARPRDPIDRLAAALPTIAVGCSAEAPARAQRRIVPRRRTFVVHPGARAPAASHEPPPLELPAGTPIIGLVGRLQPWKGQDRLLAAQAILRERGHEPHVVLVGGDAYGLSSGYAASLPALAARLGLGDAVTMTGQVSDAGPYIAQMDILVNASDPEPFGIVLLEGMARGVAVVAVDSGGPAEFLDSGSTGVLARSGEPEALADALEPLLASPEQRRTIGAAGRERYLEHYTEAAMCRRLYAALEALLADRALASGG